MRSPYHQAHFILSAAALKQLPADIGVEVAIVGRSNAGKSSVLNTLTHQKGLARTSKTPGRTQLINVFGLDETRRLIDLPGYGFAKVPLKAKLEWEKAIDAYIRSRECLKGLVVVMDIRHPFRELDLQLLSYCQHRGLSVHILLNKADKLSKGAAKQVLLESEKWLKESQLSYTVQLFSAMKGLGLPEFEKQLATWYEW